MSGMRAFRVIVFAGLALVPITAEDAASSRFGPVPFRFELHRLYLKFKGAPVFDDNFDSAGRFGPIFTPAHGNAKYLCAMGSISAAAVANGALTVSESNTINPYGPFAAKLLLPVDATGRVTFSGAESFGDFELGATLRAPNLPAGTRVNIGIGDVETLATLGAVSLETGAVLLERSGRSVWDTMPLQRIAAPELASAREVSLMFGVNAQGHFHATVRILNGDKVREINLDPPDSRATIDVEQNHLSANIFVETPPRPYILSVFPRDVSASDLQEKNGLLPLKIVGVGFSAASQATLSPPDGHSLALEGLRLTGAMSLSGTARLPRGSPARYSLLVRTGDQEFVLENALRVH
jgi:hypothetical protein